MKCNVFKFSSTCGNISCDLIYDGSSEAIHFWKQPTAICCEVGYKFWNQVVLTGLTFSEFCHQMSEEYKAYNSSSIGFVSVHTFIKWFFHFFSSFKTDFRKVVDPWCGHAPKYLACDGTHLGVKIKHLDISGIERRNNSEETRQSSHIRYDRCFLPYNKSANKKLIKRVRTDLFQFCKFILESEGDGDLDNTQKIDIITAIRLYDQRVNDFISCFIDQQFSQDLMKASASFLILLLKDASVSSVIYYRKIADIRHVLDNILNTEDLSCIDMIIDIKPSMRSLLIGCVQYDDALYCDCIVNFFIYLCDFVTDVHLNDTESDPINPIPHNYNPESGVAYYFTEHGNAIRSLPKYAKDKQDKDDDQTTFNPTKNVRGESCTKNYTKTSKQGWSHLFLFCCPIHGHCYGYHIINGSEGRKDPFSAMYKYMEEAPEEVYYDFSCSLSEYSLNREPRFFRNSRFWVDIFHSFSHQCGQNHKCLDVPNLYHSNTSFCEQFNAHLKNIKYIATHFTKSHFCFFVQLLIQRWNEQKTTLFSSKLAALQLNS